jgi:hypothetical protein
MGPEPEPAPLRPAGPGAAAKVPGFESKEEQDLKKFIVGAIALAIGAIGFGTLGAPTASAGVTGVVAVSPTLLYDCIDGVPGDTVTGADVLEATDGIDPTDVGNLADCLGDKDGTLEASDFSAIDDLDDNQVESDGDKPLALFVFVDDDDDVTVDVPTKLGTSDNDTNGVGAIAAGDYVCSAGDDLDCGGGGGDDGVVTTYIGAVGSPALGSATVNVFQADDNVSVSVTINIVGNPDEIAINEVKHTASVEVSSGSCDDADYKDGLDNDKDGDKIFMWATVTDSAGNELTMISVSWEVDDEDIAIIADDSSVTLASTVTGAFAVLCGQDDTGEVDVTASFSDVEEESDTVTKTIVGLPANVSLSASPAAIDCNGVNSATVTATVTDADGNNVVDGTEVRFDVVALGTASPIRATTKDGQASSTITPLSGNAAGVTVVVSAGDAEASVRVDCILATPTAPPASPTPGGPIRPPVTGNGGYLSQDAAGGISWIALAGLALGALALTLGGAAVRKVSR